MIVYETESRGMKAILWSGLEDCLIMIQDTITTTGTGVISGLISPGFISILFPGGGACSENDSVGYRRHHLGLAQISVKARLYQENLKYNFIKQI